MADVLEQFPGIEIGSPPLRGKLGAFMDGRVYRLTNGTDVQYQNLDSLRAAFYIASSRRGLRGRLHIESKAEPITFVFQAVPRK